MKIEMIVLINELESFCKDENGLISYIQCNNLFKIVNHSLKYKNLEFKMKIKKNSMSSGKQRYFSIELSNEELHDDDVDLYSTLKNDLFKHLAMISDKEISVNILWDDVSFYYAQKSYPLMNEIENLMRKVILKFMVISAGFDWTENNVPENIKNTLDKRRPTYSFFNVLWEMDFIHLSEVLFTNTRQKNLSDLDRLMSNQPSTINYDDLKNFLPMSNWDRYFSGKIQFNKEELRKLWAELYEIRIKIAHNRGVTKGDYLSLIKSTEILKKILEEAVSLIEKEEIVLKDEEKVAVIATVDKKSIILETLKQSEKWLNDKLEHHPSTFIGYTYFVKLVQEKGVEYDQAIEIIREIENEGRIGIEEFQTPLGPWQKKINILNLS